MKRFSDLPVSTSTILALTGMSLDVDCLYDIFDDSDFEQIDNWGFDKHDNFIPCFTSQIPVKKVPFFVQGPRQETMETLFSYRPYFCSKDNSEHLLKQIRTYLSPEYVRLYILYAKNRMKKRKGFQFTERKNCFRNALNVFYGIASDRKVYFKVTKNGKFQLTGCKNIIHASLCVIHFLHLIFFKYPECIVHRPPGDLRIVFQTVMTNVDIFTGYNINREELDKIVNEKTTFNSLLEDSFGYTGVNIKMPLQCRNGRHWLDTTVPVLRIPVDALSENIDAWKQCMTFHRDPLRSLLSEDAIQKSKLKLKNNTFLAFHSGKIIFSGMFPETMEHDYNVFCDFLANYRHVIEEKLVRT